MSDNLVEAQGYLESSRRETDPVAAMERLQQAVAWLISDGIDKERAEPVKVRVKRPSGYTNQLRQDIQESGFGVQPPNQSMTSSAPINGIAEKPYPLQSVSQDSWQQHIRMAIMDSFKSMPSTGILCTESYPDSSTLTLTFKSPSLFGQNQDGVLGHVNHDNL